jgi:L,D-transpeptidase catalytic domain
MEVIACYIRLRFCEGGVQPQQSSSSVACIVPRCLVFFAIRLKSIFSRKSATNHFCKRMKQFLVFGGIFFTWAMNCFAQRAIEIDLTNQEAYLTDHGRVILSSPICSGRPGHETPTGDFQVTDKDLNHASSFYGFFGNPATKQIVVPDADKDMKVPSGLEFVQAPMRYYVQFQPAIGLHAGFLPGHPDSHGCIRMPEQYAVAFFQESKVGTPVHVYGFPQVGRAYWASRRSHPSGVFHLAMFGFRGGSNPDEEAFRHRREAAFDQFDDEWDAKEKVLERQIDALEDRKDRADGWRKEQLKAELGRFEQLKDDFEIRRDAAKETLKRQWGD